MTQSFINPDVVRSYTTTPIRTRSRYSLEKGQALHPNEFIQSPNGRLAFVLQRDGNLVAYATDSEIPVPLWASHTNLRDIAQAHFQEDGNLVLNEPNGTPVWASDTNGKGGQHIIAQDDGNVVMYTADGHPVWDTGSYGFDARNLHNDRSFFEATGRWIERIWVGTSIHPPKWLGSISAWVEENEPIIYAAFGGAAGFLVGGPAGAAAGSALLKSAFALGESVQTGKIDPNVILAFVQASAAASGVELPSIDDIPGMTTIQAALADGQRAFFDIDVGKLGVNFDAISKNTLPWMNPVSIALQQSVAQGKTKILDESGHLILGFATAPNSVTALSKETIETKQLFTPPGPYWEAKYIHSYYVPINAVNTTAYALTTLGVTPGKSYSAAQLAYDALRGKPGAAAFANGMTNDLDHAVMQAALDITKRMQVRHAYVVHYLGMK